MFFGWCDAIAITLFALVIYIGFFWKVNWISDLRHQSKMKYRKTGKLPPVYPNGWFALLESSQIKVGEVKHIAALGENFAVFRTEKGIINILDAYCPHLGANMGEGGLVKGECLECPFHSWLFRGEDGHCYDIPYADKVPYIARTKVWMNCEVNKIIFVWYHAESSKPTWQPRPHASISNGTWRYQGRNEFMVSCHIQDIAENGADLAHLSAVHGPAILLPNYIKSYVRHTWSNTKWKPHCSKYHSMDESSIKSNGTTISESRIEDEIKTEPILNGFSKMSTDIETQMVSNEDTIDLPQKRENHRASMSLRHSLLLFERFEILTLDLKIEQIGPGYVELQVDTTFGSMLILQTVTPMEPLVQRVAHTIFCPPLLAPYASLIFLGKCMMVERDIAIWNHKKFEHRPILVFEDRGIASYRRWYSQFYSTSSPTYQMAVKSLQW